MAYVNDLIISSEKETVLNFFQEIQKVFRLKHIGYLTPHGRSLSGVLKQNHQEEEVRSDDHGVFSEVH